MNKNLCSNVNDAVEEHIDKEICRLRFENELLRSWIKLDEDMPRCVVCGKPIKGLSLQRILRPFLWDSRECFEYKPRKIIALEREYGLDIRDILKETSRKFGGLKEQCEAIGFSVPWFVRIIKKYNGCGYLEFMSKHTTGNRRKAYLYRYNNLQSLDGKKRSKSKTSKK